MDDTLTAKPILLTGGRGCLAGVLGRYLESQGAAITRLSRTPGDGYIALENFFAGRVAARGGMLLHLACSTVPYTAERKLAVEQKEDLPLLERIFDRLASWPGDERPHLIFFSSGGSVYGNASGGQPNREDDPCHPIGRHGQAKLAAEQLLEKRATQLGIAWTILRVSNPYGFAVPAGRRQGIIPLAIKAAGEGRPLTIWGDGTARKDFLYHSDFSRAVGLIIRRRPVGIFNLCSGETHSVEEIITVVEQTIGRPIILRYATAFPWDVHESCLDCSKLRAAVDWQPLVPLAEGLRRAASDIFPR